MQPDAHAHRHHDEVRSSASVHPRPRWPQLCWLFVLVAIGVVQIVRAQWFDAAVFFAAAVGATMLMFRAPLRHSGGMPLPALVAFAAVFAAALCLVPRHGAMMQGAVIVIGAAAVATALTDRAVAHPDRQTTSSRGIHRLALAWAIIAVAGCVWELIQFILGLVEPDAAWFSLSDLLNPLVGTAPGKILIVLAWVAGGVWLLRRGGRR